MQYTPEQVTANRKRYLRSLRTSKNQAHGSLMALIGGKVCRCALGVGLPLVGIRTPAQYRELSARQRSELYESIPAALGIPADRPFRGPAAPNVTGKTIYRMNDVFDKTFAEIADWLEGEWAL